MKYISTNNLTQSNNIDSFQSNRSSIAKRLFLMMMITMFLVFAGFQSAPTTTQAAATKDGCELVCGAPFIDPNDGQCYQMCCPVDEECKRACELRPCIK
jgi:hypothetical protein